MLRKNHKRLGVLLLTIIVMVACTSTAFAVKFTAEDWANAKKIDTQLEAKGNPLPPLPKIAPTNSQQETNRAKAIYRQPLNAALVFPEKGVIRREKIFTTNKSLQSYLDEWDNYVRFQWWGIPISKPQVITVKDRYFYPYLDKNDTKTTFSEEELVQTLLRDYPEENFNLVYIISHNNFESNLQKKAFKYDVENPVLTIDYSPSSLYDNKVETGNHGIAHDVENYSMSKEVPIFFYTKINGQISMGIDKAAGGHGYGNITDERNWPVNYWQGWEHITDMIYSQMLEVRQYYPGCTEDLRQIEREYGRWVEATLHQGKEYNIITSTQQKNLKLDRKITKADAAVLFYQTYLECDGKKKNGVKDYFSDLSGLTSEQREAINQLAAIGIINSSSKKFSPKTSFSENTAEQWTDKLLDRFDDIRWYESKSLPIEGAEKTWGRTISRCLALVEEVTGKKIIYYPLPTQIYGDIFF